MTEQALAQLLAELFTTIRLLSGYPVPHAYPQIHQLPRTQLEARLCRTGCRVKAFYLKEEGVYIDAELDMEHDLLARSILLHELVHHVQGESGRFGSLPDCYAWYAREREAYQIQNQYLRDAGSNTSYYMDGFARDCLKEDANQAGGVSSPSLRP